MTIITLKSAKLINIDELKIDLTINESILSCFWLLDKSPLLHKVTYNGISCKYSSLCDDLLDQEIYKKLLEVYSIQQIKNYKPTIVIDSIQYNDNTIIDLDIDGIKHEVLIQLPLNNDSLFLIDSKTYNNTISNQILKSIQENI